MTDVRTTDGGLEYVLTGPSQQSRGFVMNSMTRQLQTVPGYRDLPRADLRRHFDELERRWDDPTLIRLVAVDPTDPWLVLGFIVGSPAVLTWLHVRGGFRGLGLARALAAELDITPETDAVVEFATWDLVRYEASTDQPAGLLHNPGWNLTLIPWRER